MEKYKLISFWLILYLLLGIVGGLVGMNAIIPGPNSENALRRNQGENLALEKDLAPTDGFLILVSKRSPSISQENFEIALRNLSKVLKNIKNEEGIPIFKLIQSSVDSFAFDTSRFISKTGEDQIIIASGGLPVFKSTKDFLAVPDVLEKWSEEHPDFEYSFVSNATGEAEVIELVNRDLDRSLIFTTPLTILVLVWAFRSWLAAFIPLFIAGVSLIGSLGVSAVLSQFISGISITASQLVVLLVLAIGVDYSLFFITRAREEVSKGHGAVLAIERTKSTTGVAVFWSGLIVSISLFGLLLIQDTVLNSMAFVSIVSVLMTLVSCVLVLPKILMIFPSCLENKVQEEHSASAFSEKLILLSLKYPLFSATSVVSFLLFLSYFSLSINLGNTMIPEILPKSLQGMRMYSNLQAKFPELAGGDASVILNAKNLEELEEAGDLDTAMQELREYGLRGPFKTEKSSDGELIRYKFLIDGYQDVSKTKEFVDRLKNEALPKIANEFKVDAYLSGVIEYAVSEANRYKSKMYDVFLAVLSFSFIFLLVAFRSIAIPLKAIILNLLSTTASFGVLVLVFQSTSNSPFYYGIIESFVPPLLFTILFGLSMDYHVFMISRVTEEFHKTGDTAQAVLAGIKYTSRTITSAALIMISVFFVAASLELPVMKQLGIGLGVAVLIDATLIRTILLPSTMILLGKWNWYLPKFLEFIPKLKL